jgi:hypothetical protein
MYLSEQMRRRGVKLRERTPGPIREVEARGLQEMSARLRAQAGNREQREREEVMSVAMAQPHRRDAGKYDPNDGTELGRFCKRHWRDPDVIRDRRLAGEAYAQVVADERVAQGLPDRQWSPSGVPSDEMTPEQLEARKYDAVARRRKAEEAIREVDDKSVRVMERLCYEDAPIGLDDEGRAVNALWKLAVFFNYDRPGYHDKAIDPRKNRW